MKNLRSKRIIFLLTIFLLIFEVQTLDSSNGNKQIETKLIQLISDLENNLRGESLIANKLILVVHSFTYDQDGLEATSEFSEYLIDKLEGQLGKCKVFTLMPRDKVKKIVSTRDWKIEKVTPTIPENLAAFAGAEAVLIGKFENFGNKIKISALIRDVRSQKIISDASVLIPKDNLPNNLSILSENSQKVSFTDMVDITIDTLDNINLEVFVDHAVDKEYEVGESMKIYVKADKSCYIRVIYRDTEGEDVLLFPRSPSDNDYIEANRTYVIPPDDSYRIVAVEPYGTECLKVLASTNPFGSSRSVDIPILRARGIKIEDNQKLPSYGEKNITIRVSPPKSAKK